MNQHSLKLLSLRHLFISTILLSAFGTALAIDTPATTEQTPKIERSEATYVLPDINLVRHDGQKVSLLKEFADERILLVNFIYTSCSAICPMMSYVFAKTQKKLGADAAKVHFASISIDPENDNPKTLTDYAQKFNGAPGWDFYTGALEASIALQKAFNTFRGDKMNHALVLFIRAKPGNAWVRYEGFVSTDHLIREIREHLASNAPTSQ